MRAMWGVAGFGVLAIGMVLGVVVSGFTPGAEAAPPDKGGDAGGRLIELGTQLAVAPGAQYESALVEVGDCTQMVIYVQGDPGARLGATVSVRSSIDGVTAFNWDELGSGGSNSGNVARPDTASGAYTLAYTGPNYGGGMRPNPFRYLQFAFTNDATLGFTTDVTGSLWCSFN